MRAAAAAAAFLFVMLLVSGAAAQGRASISTWGPGLDVDALAQRSGIALAPTTRVTLSGTLTSTVDGERYDAFHRITDAGPQRVPLVVLPPDARIIEEDYEAHRYTVEMKRGRLLRLDLRVIGQRSLHTVSEIRSGLRGAIVADVVGDPIALSAAAAGAGAEPPMSGAALATYGALAATPPMLLLAFFGAFRRRRRPERALMRRIRVAVAAVHREAKRLGPAFAPVQSAADASRAEAERLFRAHQGARGAKRRLRAIGGSGNARFVDSRRRRAAGPAGAHRPLRPPRGHRRLPREPRRAPRQCR